MMKIKSEPAYQQNLNEQANHIITEESSKFTETELSVANELLSIDRSESSSYIWINDYHAKTSENNQTDTNHKYDQSNDKNGNALNKYQNAYKMPNFIDTFGQVDDTDWFLPINDTPRDYVKDVKAFEAKPMFPNKFLNNTNESLKALDTQNCEVEYLVVEVDSDYNVLTKDTQSEYKDIANWGDIKLTNPTEESKASGRNTYKIECNNDNQMLI